MSRRRSHLPLRRDEGRASRARYDGPVGALAHQLGIDPETAAATSAAAAAAAAAVGKQLYDATTGYFGSEPAAADPPDDDMVGGARGGAGGPSSGVGSRARRRVRRSRSRPKKYARKRVVKRSIRKRTSSGRYKRTVVKRRVSARRKRPLRISKGLRKKIQKVVDGEVPFITHMVRFVDPEASTADGAAESTKKGSLALETVSSDTLHGRGTDGTGGGYTASGREACGFAPGPYWGDSGQVATRNHGTVCGSLILPLNTLVQRQNSTADTYSKTNFTAPWFFGQCFKPKYIDFRWGWTEEGATGLDRATKHTVEVICGMMQSREAVLGHLTKTGYHLKEAILRHCGYPGNSDQLHKWHLGKHKAIGNWGEPTLGDAATKYTKYRDSRDSSIVGTKPFKILYRHTYQHTPASYDSAAGAAGESKFDNKAKMGYFGEGSYRFNFTSEVELAEAQEGTDGTRTFEPLPKTDADMLATGANFKNKVYPWKGAMPFILIRGMSIPADIIATSGLSEDTLRWAYVQHREDSLGIVGDFKIGYYDKSNIE